jgi:hypothetical protein
MHLIAQGRQAARQAEVLHQYSELLASAEDGASETGLGREGSQDPAGFW